MKERVKIEITGERLDHMLHTDVVELDQVEWDALLTCVSDKVVELTKEDPEDEEKLIKAGVLGCVLMKIDI